MNRNQLALHTTIMGVIKMENIAPRAGIKPTYIAFRISVLTITPSRLSDGTTESTPISLCGLLPYISVQNARILFGLSYTMTMATLTVYIACAMRS